MMKSLEVTLDRASTAIAGKIIELQDGQKAWKPVTGQYIVYGLESVIGFLNSVDLESQIEKAWKNFESGDDKMSELKSITLNFLKSLDLSLK